MAIDSLVPAGNSCGLGSRLLFWRSSRAFAAVLAIVGNSLNPPQNVPIDGHVTGPGRTRHARLPMAFGEMSESEFTDFLKNRLTCTAAANIDGPIHFVQRQISYKQTSGESGGALLRVGRFTSISNNIGSVKSFLSTPLPALRRARHFALVENSPSSTPARF
jgi:hypothetical protein